MVTAREVVGTVADPELPMLSLVDLGVVRDVREEDGRVVVVITPTYSGCPALVEMRDDLVNALHTNGFEDAEVRTVLSPAWTTDWMTEEGRRKLAEAGISPPGRVGPRPAGPVPLRLDPPAPRLSCPQCGSRDTEELSRFSATACKALHRCRACREPFEYFKEI
ncbi:phenylacetate-CoA oxygenase subunit PaaJ [Allokutzneria sp. A3M-2-11 16]|uniref:1,2-phenylacetyl-CoA epoxidase subunit PaaD n=1 Tax=Allokutzneria sp. A3M-2-11 16 TaxID=2962043 RepID=UPI0020B70186|nr:1,2-phenylacetyl-CoA epoxidase subunit PaaD [Allokutzneria sp. A3M-2-11 16]MCP3802066.1 phenylacetate-CoA oxygenase subunit PaaJ [Allokutzneria sp. A3M-2-11 16]